MHLLTSQSAKTIGNADDRGTMAEKTKGRKRHIVTDIDGNLLYVKVHAANIHDTKAGQYVIGRALQLYPSLMGVCADA